MEKSTFPALLEDLPPGTERHIDGVASNNGRGVYLVQPIIRIHCPSEGCQGTRNFSPTKAISMFGEAPHHVWAEYQCNDCKASLKSFALVIDDTDEPALVGKIGEIPAFGKPIPPRAMSLVGSDRDLFLKGRRCENQGLGVAAFAYYRRVIEDQRNRIFDEIIRVLSKTHPSHPVIADLEDAKRQRQFTTSVDAIKHALPDSLMVNGHNPLKLLHSALSEGVHNMSDESCLELAQDVRTVLFEFSEKLGSALKEQNELVSAVGRLAAKRSAATPPAPNLPDGL